MVRILSRSLILTTVLIFVFGSLHATEVRHAVDIDRSDLNMTQPEAGVVSLAMDGCLSTNYLGLPELPFRVVSLLLPQGESVRSFYLDGGSVISISTEASVSLFMGDYLDDGTLRGLSVDAAEVTGKDSVFPAWQVRHLGTRSMKGYRIASFAVYPIRYNTDTGELSLISNFDLVVETEPAMDYDSTVERVRYVDGFRESARSDVESIVVNPSEAASYSFNEVVVDTGDRGFLPSYLPSMEGSEVKYLIITNAEMESSFQVLADWKTKKGIPAVVRTIEWIQQNFRMGTDRGETIRNFIVEAYAKWGVEYVLLGGDTDIIPARYAYVSFYTGDFLPTEMYYSCLDGNWNADGDSIWGEAYHSTLDPGDDTDLYAEVYVGRMPVSTVSEADIVIGKTITYETPVETTSKAKFLLLGEVIFPTLYQAGDDIILDGAEILEDVYLPYLQGMPDREAIRLYEAYFDYPGAYLLSKSSAVDSMNAGVNHVMHAGHGGKYNMAVGSGTILNYDAANLVNGDALFSMYLMNCTNVAYDTDCLAEYFLLNANGGAFAVTGSSRSAFPSTSRPYLDNYYHLLFVDDVVQLGKVHTKSREPYTSGASAETADRWTHYIYNYLGDPELCMFRGEVGTFDVAYPATTVFGVNEITITVTSDGSPFDSAYVCLHKEGDDYVYGYTDMSGEIVFSDFLCRDHRFIDLTVTGLDHARFNDSISVVQETNAFLRVDKTRINDYVVGNNDNILDSGESVVLSVKVANTGEMVADKVYAFVRSSNPAVTVSDSVAIYPQVGLIEPVYGLDAFAFSVLPTVEDEEIIEFIIDIHDSTGGFWSEKFAIEVHAPDLELYINALSDELPYGDGDGTITSGESFLLNVSVKNFGSGTATGLEGVIRTTNGGITIVDSTSIYINLPTLGVGEGSGFVLSEMNLYTSNYFEFELTDAFGRVYTRALELREPASPDSLFLDASFGPTEIHITWDPPDDMEPYRYLVYHSLTPGGPYEQVSDDLVFHTMFRDVGLLSSTWYYFVVAAVDSCGNLSSYSPEVTTTTSPPQLAGWPNKMSKESSSSPNIGDIDGDTHADIVIGSDYVHAWRGDGVELRDGDGQPITWGIFNTEGTTFTASVALGELDGVQGLEIVGAAWDTKKLYVFNKDGVNLPGFPKTTVDLCWASPVLGDFDGDGDLEIIAYDVDGTVYVWHHDGTELRDGDSNPSTDGPFFSAGSASDGWHVSTPAMADMDGDGVLELIVCAPSDNIYCLNYNGTSVPGWPVAVDVGASISASPAVGDVDNDGYPEVVVQTSWSRVYGLNHDGTEMPGWPKWVNSSTFFNSSPAMADLTGDGFLEVILPGQNGYLYIFTSTGASLPGWPIVYSTSAGTESSPVVADISGDGNLDIILGAEDGFLKAWDINGDFLPGFPIKLNGYIRGTPIVSDMDLDGDVELIASCWDQNVFVWDIEAPTYYGYRAWNGFHCNSLNSGWIDQPDLTGAEGMACSYMIDRGDINLNWSVSAGVESWDLFRKQPDAEYELLAAELRADQAGTVIYRDLSVEEGLTYIYRLQASGNDEFYAETEGIEVPVQTARMYQNYPNPFNPMTRIAYTVPGGASSVQNVLLNVYDVRGALIKTLVNSPVTGGRHIVTWDGTNNRGAQVSSGVYFSRFSTGGHNEVKKMLLLR
ncbi:MAG: VCBS repeat-containing protein [Candidatus Krumholzibacteria bacterium]|nr:VCBS repeat-containing protein [Candidatus Krumholzibacteria bacterium]